MKRVRVIVSVTPLLLLFCSLIDQAIAQSRCDSVLAGGAFRIESVKTSEYAKLVMLAEFSKMDLDTANNTFSHEGRVGIGPIQIGPGTWNKDSLKSDQEKVESSIDVNNILDNESSVLRSSGDPEVLNAWSDCIKDGGLSLYLKPFGESAAIAGVIWYPYPGNPTQDPVVESFTVNSGNKVTSGIAYTRRGAKLGIRFQREIEISRVPEGSVLVMLHTSVGDVHAYLPALPKSSCHAQKGLYDFYGNKCGDGYAVSGSVVTVSFGSGGSVTVPQNIPTYRADLGFWSTGDFNGDGLTDLVHFVVGVPNVDPYVHIFFSRGAGEFAVPTAGFNFRQHANGLGDYDANLGSWSIGYDPITRRSTLVHDPKLPDGRIHVWRSNGDGIFSIGVP